jgi:hypothetical protein
MRTALYSLFVVLAGTFLAMSAHAATLFFGAPSEEVGIAPVEIGAFLNTEGVSINAVEGEVVLPATVELRGVQTGSSVVSVWLEQPKGACEAECRIRFSGIIPGGYSGPDGYLFSAIVIAPAGTLSVTAESVRTYKNDGFGTEIQTDVAGLELTVSATAETPALPDDTVAPEPFTIELSKDANVFDGQYFIAFQAQDKLSGVSFYEVREYDPWWPFAEWVRADSPYVLNDQDLSSVIEVRAVDQAGNERVSQREPTRPLVWYERPFIFGIIGVIIIFAVWFIFRRRRA